jgi:hypothetical protein
MNTVIKPALLAGLGILSLSAMTEANAADLRVNANVRMERAQDIKTDGRWIPAHYETRSEQVLVSPERKEIRVIPAVTETRRDYYGKPYTVLVTPERREEICIPAQYRTVETKVWVPAQYVGGNNGRGPGFQDRDHDGRNDRFEDDKGHKHDGPAFPDRDQDGRNDRYEDDKGRVPDRKPAGFLGFSFNIFK